MEKCENHVCIIFKTITGLQYIEYDMEYMTLFEAAEFLSFLVSQMAVQVT